MLTIDRHVHVLLSYRQAAEALRREVVELMPQDRRWIVDETAVVAFGLQVHGRPRPRGRFWWACAARRTLPVPARLRLWAGHPAGVGA